MPYVPARGDVVWIHLDPQAGHEQAGHRPALVVSRRAFNRKTGLIIICPVTSRQKRNAFEIALPLGLAVRGVVMTHHVKSLDWQARDAQFMARVPAQFVDQVLMSVVEILS